MPLKPIIITHPEEMTDDSTLDDEYQIQYWDSLDDETRRLIALHYQDQWDAVPSYFSRYRDNPGLIERED